MYRNSIGDFNFAEKENYYIFKTKYDSFYAKYVATKENFFVPIEIQAMQADLSIKEERVLALHILEEHKMYFLEEIHEVIDAFKNKTQDEVLEEITDAINLLFSVRYIVFKLLREDSTNEEIVFSEEINNKETLENINTSISYKVHEQRRLYKERKRFRLVEQTKESFIDVLKQDLNSTKDILKEVLKFVFLLIDDKNKTKEIFDELSKINETKVKK